jgi:hypothetical protein
MKPCNVPEFAFVRLVANHNILGEISLDDDTMPTAKTTGTNDSAIVGSRGTAPLPSEDAKQLHSKKKGDIIKDCVERVAKIRRIESGWENKNKVVAKLIDDLEKMRGVMVEVTNCSSGASTILSRGTSVVPVVKEYSVNDKYSLGRIVRGELLVGAKDKPG